MLSDRPQTPKDDARRSSRRQSHRSSGVHLLAPSTMVHYPVDTETLPLESGEMVQKFDRLSDSLEEMESNMTQLQSLHKSISSEFNEAFSSFLYGLSITMWCVEFPGCPSRKKWDQKHANRQIDARIRALENKLLEATRNHQQLKLKLEEYDIQDTKDDTNSNNNNNNKNSSPAATASAATIITKPNVITTTQPVLPSSKIPQLKSKPSDGSPNLNQPPRYMRGLFDSSNARVPRKRESKVTKPGAQARPRFR